ncbi:MAG: hypothetical protein ABIO70_13340 [Pseudomonadota bacterium]
MAAPSPRYLICHLPGFRLERCGWEPRQCVALVAEQKSALRVLACSPPAARDGVAPGQALSQARALCPGLQVELLDPAAERQDLVELARQLHRVAPAVAALPPAALAAELPPLRGVHDPRAEAAALEQAHARLEALGHAARVVVAEDLFAGQVLAAWAPRDLVVPPGGLCAALAPLPIAALGPSEPMAALLRDLGLRRVGELAALAPADVTGRFGAEGLRLHRLAHGRLGSVPLSAREAEGGPARAWELPAPAEVVEPLLFALNRMCAELCEELGVRSQAALGLELELEIEEAAPVRLALRSGQPSRSPARFTRLLLRRLEGLALPGPVLALRLEARPVVPFAGAQAPLLSGGQAHEPLAQVAARLADAFGAQALCFPSPRDRWRPEAAWAPEAAFDESGRFRAAPAPAALARAAVQDPVEHHDSWRLALPRPRPALLLPEPRPVQFEPRLGVPRRVQVEGRWFAVARAWGPEALQVEWWAAGIDRRYWVLELEDGRGLWVYTELGHAYLHGFFDQGSGAPVIAGGAA